MSLEALQDVAEAALPLDRERPEPDDRVADLIVVFVFLEVCLNLGVAEGCVGPGGH